MIRFVPLCAVLFTGCAGSSLAPPPTTPDPATAERVRSLSDGNPCSDTIAGALTAYRIPAAELASLDQPVVSHDHPGEPIDHQAWFHLTGRGSVIVYYDPSDCRVSDIYARDGAVLPEIG
jgi:hypothetical protein